MVGHYNGGLTILEMSSQDPTCTYVVEVKSSVLVGPNLTSELNLKVNSPHSKLLTFCLRKITTSLTCEVRRRKPSLVSRACQEMPRTSSSLSRESNCTPF